MTNKGSARGGTGIQNRAAESSLPQDWGAREEDKVKRGMGDKSGKIKDRTKRWTTGG